MVFAPPSPLGVVDLLFFAFDLAGGGKLTNRVNMFRFSPRPRVGAADVSDEAGRY